MSATRMARRSFSRRNVGRRPRGNRPVGPLITHFSSINCSVISETVLRCSPDTRARSAREIGWRCRIKFSTTLRLMSRAVSLEATCVFVKSSRRMGESRFVLQKAGHELYLVRGTNFMKVSWRFSRQGTKSLLFSFSKKLFKREDLSTISPHMSATKRNASLALIFVLLCATAESAAQKRNHWVGSWATSQQLAEPKNSLSADDLNDITLRQIVHLSIGGSQLRVHLSNRFGTAPLHF